MLTLNIPPIVSSTDRIRLWQAILKTTQTATVTVKPGETPEIAIKIRCGSAPNDLTQLLYDLNPGMVRSATADERTLKFIPCPFWYFGKDGTGPKVPVKAGEKLQDLLPALMGTSGSTTTLAVVDMNQTLVKANGEIIRDGQLALPYISRRLKVPVSPAESTNNPLSVAQPILGALPAVARKVVKSSGISLSPNEYHLVGTDEPVTDDPIQACGGPKAAGDWPSNVQAISNAYESARKELLAPALPGVILVADTGMDTVLNQEINGSLWTNSAVLNGLPSATNFRKDLHGASMVTRSGDDIAPTPGYEYRTHGTNVVRVMMEPAVRSSKLIGGALIAIAKLNDETSPFTIELNSIPSAFGYARAISADVLSLSVVIGAPVDALLQELKAANFLVIVAAGNNGIWLEQQSIFPPALNQLRDHLLVVGAHDWRGNVAWFSNKGPLVDILAPGCAIPQVSTEGGAKLLSGTSFAAPFVSLTVGLLRAIGMPSSPLLIKTRILASSDFDPNLIGATRYGVRLNMERALRIRRDSITRKIGTSQEVLYGDIESPQTWTCDVRGESRAFNAAQVFKLLPNFPVGNGSAVRAWARPSLGELVEVQCDGPFDQAMFRFKPEGSPVAIDYPWSEIHDVVPRISPN